MTTIEKQLNSIIFTITSSGLRIEELEELKSVIEKRIDYLKEQQK